MSEHDSIVSVKSLSVRFGRERVLDDLVLEVPCGSVTALVGSNGAGKSTLLRVLVGALVPNAGTARVLGLDPSHDGPRLRARIGYVPDRIETPNWMRGRDWLAFVARFYPTWSTSHARHWLQLLELDDSAKIAALSKGNRTKLALVAALAHSPALLLLDEPFSGLDVDARRAITTAVLTSLRDEGHTVLFVSHSIRDVERLADRVAVLSKGRIMLAGDLEDVARDTNGSVDLEATLHELASVDGGAR
jgi:ABC-2 type transport system ATP-binding protein